MKKAAAEKAVADPLLRIFQFDQTSFGEIANWVNMFRGEVGTALPLVSLPGRNGLEVKVSLLYSSNVWNEALVWNQTAPTSVLGLGWKLPIDAIVATPNGTGRIEEYAYTLMANGTGNSLIFDGYGDGGELLFELLDYSFRPIRYIPADERWEIVREDGVVMVFGGGVTVGTDGNKHCAGNSAAWGVGFGNWLGPGSGGGQHQYGKSWFLSGQRGFWGDKITYSYRADECAIGPSGLNYTRATYLQSVVDVFGRTVTFSYRDKEPFEYQPDHSDPVYQDEYETLYLSGLQVSGPDGDPITTIGFEHKFMNLVNAGVQNSFCKRYLTAITESPVGWEVLPGYLFDYNEAPAINPGALANVTHPQGGVVSFKYEQQTLAKTSNNTTAQSKVGIPRVWFGPDYAVVTWYSAAQQHLEVDIYSWMGTWKYTGSSSVLTGMQLDLAELSVYPEEKFFVLAFANGASDSQVQNAYVYDADPNRAGYWSSTAYQLPLQAGASQTQVATGSSFFILANPGFTDGTAVRRYLKTPGQNEWELSLPVPGPGLIALAAGESCYIQCAYDQSSQSGVFELWYIKDFAWQSGSQWSEAFTIAAGQDWQNYFWSMGDGFAVATSVKEVTDNLASYEVRAYAWDSSYKLLGNAIVQQHQDSVDLPFLPAVVEHGMVANAHHLLRFDGSQWHPFDVPLPGGLDPSKIHFAYGEDVAVVSTPSGSVLAAFDPSSLSWTPTSLSTPYGTTTIDGACLTIGSAVFQRQPNGQWQKQNTPLPPDTVDGSVRNRGSFLIFERNQGTSACACFVKNGATQQVLTLPEPLQSIATSDTSPGMELVGSQCFAAYPMSAGTFDDTHILYFYYLLHDSVAGAQEVFRVSQVLVDAGMPGEAPICTAYLYDDDSVLYDPFGRIAKYHQVRKVTGADPNAPGSWAAPGSAPFGSQISIFYNGLQPGDSGTDTPSLPSSGADLYYNWLDGQLIGTNSFDSNGTQIASTQNTWEVSTTRATPNGPIPLAGAYSRIAAQTQTRDGVITQVQYTYDASSGVRIGTQKQATQPDGATLLFNQRLTPWWSIYDPSQSRNLLTAMVQRIDSTIDSAGHETITSAAATTWKNDWGTPDTDWAEFETFHLAQQPGSNFSGFDSWNPRESPDPSVWLKVKSVATRTGQGLEQESLDVDRIPSTNLYSEDSSLPLVYARNASFAGQELAFCGFEANEAPAAAGWLYAESDLTTADCYTGSRCLALTAATSATAKLTGTFAPARGGQAYLLSFYSRSGEEVPDAYVEISFAGATDQPLQIPIQFAGPNWNFQCQPVSFPDSSGGGTPAVTIAFFNTSAGQTVLLDDVRFSPLCAIFEAYTYDPTSFTRSTKIGHDGRTARYLYDGYQRCIGTTDRDNEPDKLSLFYFSRQGNDDVFTPTDPNATIEIAINGGWFDDFRSTQWQDAWQATAGVWAVISNALTLTGTAAGRIACKTTADYGSSGLRAYVTPPANVTQPFGITAGNATVSWSPGTGWQLEIDGAVCGAVTSVAIGPGEWLLIYAGRLVSFFFQGKQLFNHATSAPAEGGVALFAGDAVAFSEVMALRDPEVVATYADGAGQRRQRQELDGIACNVSAWLYDPIGNRAVETKACSYPGAGLGYRPGLITSFDWETGILSGDVALYYSSGGGGPSDDGGYPYRRTLLEDSPLCRPIEKGNPGAPYAIDLTNAKRHTTRYAYGSQSTPLYAQFLTTPDGVQRTTISDQLGKTWSVSFSAADAAVATSGFLYDPAGYLHHEQQPNYLTPPSGVPADWQIVNTYDFLGRLSSTASPDDGTTLYICDRAGRQRFMLDAVGAVTQGGLNAVVYWKYDDLGRLLEKGIVQVAWGDGTVLQSYEDPDWPSLPGSFQWAKRYVYDALSGSTTAPGHLCQVSTSQTGQSADVVEDFEYESYGLVSRHGLTIPTSPMGRMVTVYHLDCRGRKTEIDYPAPQGEVPPLTVCYKYDDAGRLVQVGTPSAPGFFAAYTYYADNTIAQETLNPTGAKPMSLDFRYDSPQWLSSIGDSTGLWQQSTRYAPENSQPGSYDGLVSSDSQKYQWAGAPSGYTYILTHSMSGSLSTAVNSAIPAWGIDTPVSYDSNGNILALSSGGSVSTYQYEPGSNRLANISTENGVDPTVGFTYDPDGSVTEVSGSGLTLSYEPASRLTAAISVAGSAPGKIAFLYGGRGQRVLKSMVTHGTRLYYLHGFDPRPLMERTDSAAGPTNKLYIYGARGMLCLMDETFYWTALDRQGSTRLVLGAQSTVVATYDYLPFGGVARQTGSLLDITSYLYAGLELDAETKLYNNKARLYDPVIGRFYSCDPARQYPSPYIYAGSAPMDLTDPTGDWSMGASIGIFAIVGLIAGAIIGAGIGSFFVGAAEAGVAAAEAGAAAAEAGAAAAEAAPAVAEAEGAAAEAAVAGAAEPAAEAAPAEGWISWAARGIGRGIGYVVRAPFTAARALAVGVGEANPEVAPLLQGAANYGGMAGRAAVDAAGAIADQAVSAASTITRTVVVLFRGAAIGGGLGITGGAVLGDQLYKND